ncbi:MAG TPA: ergothioneine biosynthesis protein EgtB [Burkholderiales bacterium]|nr:ergothioneine biosynthesis protein EgtB [Burkholderiales bacterium]
MRKIPSRNPRFEKKLLIREAPTFLSELAERYARVRETSKRLLEPLTAEDCALQSMPDASPTKWHLAHTSWFFETFILERFVAHYRPFHPAYRVLFNSYYNTVGDKHPRPERGLISRPDINEVLAYRSHVDEQMAALFEEPPADRDEFAALAELGVNHEEQHQELMLTDIKHLFWKNPLRPAYRSQWPLTMVRARKTRRIAFAGGTFQVGDLGIRFAFDNERPRHAVILRDFEIASHPVTHGEFLNFVENGGYQRPELWLSMGWDILNQQGWQAPQYWERDNGDWYTFTLHGMEKIDPHAPVSHISFFEANAYARWAGARLPTEAEWERVASEIAVDGNFLESAALHPLALRRDPPRPGLAQLFGDVWEWTQSSYAPYPGFRLAQGAVGEYNGKFMCNQYVLRGGSCATPKAHVRATYRNFFPPEARWQFSGLRLAWDAQ